MRVTVLFLLSVLIAQACSTKPASTEVTTEAKEVKPEGLQLIEMNDCQTCHHSKNTLVGPSYSAIASKYDESEEVVTMLSSKVIKGGAGVWGDIPMNPHPVLSEEDAKRMVRYVLTLEVTTQ
jgi:cytochrome c